MTEDKDVTLTIRMTGEMRVFLEEQAQEADQSVAQVIREAIREWYELPEAERAKIIRRHRQNRRNPE